MTAKDVLREICKTFAGQHQIDPAVVGMAAGNAMLIVDEAAPQTFLVTVRVIPHATVTTAGGTHDGN